MFRSIPSNSADSGGGLKAPTSLSLKKSGGSSAQYYAVLSNFGLSLTAAVTSTTLTEVLNLTGSGVVNFASFITSTATTASATKIKIEVDGLVVLENLSAGSYTDDENGKIIGSIYFNNTGSELGFSEGIMVYTKSFKVSIAGDGTNGMYFVYSEYST